MKKLLAVCFVVCIGCKGPAGKDGSAGKIGPTGPAQVVNLFYSVAGDDFIVTDPRLKDASGVLVYNGDSSTFAELPYFLPSIGKNTYYIFTPSMSKLEIFNASTAGATQVVVTIILG